MAKPKLTDKENSFVEAFILHKGELIEAYRASKYSQALTPKQMSVQANKLYNKPNINLAINDLQKEADRIAKESFSISLEWRLKMLLDIANAGIATYSDQGGNQRRENLTASTGAIKTMNEMLGVGSDEQDAQSLNINFTVSQPVGDIKITRGE